MLLNLIRCLRGYVTFGVRGRFPERFINLTARKGVRLWDVRRSPSGLRAAMYMADYRRIRPVARAAGVCLRMDQRHGLPVFARRWSGRMGLAVGAFVFVLTVFMMSRFIWSIDITGLNTLSESEVRALLHDHGLYIGAFTPSLDPHGISRAVMLDNGKVGWMAVNITGSYASVEIKEESTAPEIPDVKAPANIKASRDGTVVDIRVTEGRALTEKGSGVAEGQLLVEGVLDDKMGGVRLVRSDAVILAATAHAADFIVPARVTVTLPTGEWGERRSLNLFGWRVPFAGYAVRSGSGAGRDRLDSLRVLDTDLPVGVVSERMIDLSEQEITYDENSARELLEKHARLYEVFALADCTVTDRRFFLTHTDAGYTLSAAFDCIEDIAVQSPIGTDAGTDRLRREPAPKSGE